MEPGLTIALSLDRQQCIRGESVFFGCVLTNVGSGPLGLPSLDPINRSVTITLTNSDGRALKSDQMAVRERDGIYDEPPRRLPGVRLPPGKPVELTGDLLTWFKDIPPGTYQVRADYAGGLETATSEPAKLVVDPASPAASSTPRPGLALPEAPVTGAWVHNGPEGCVLFYQHLSPWLPRNVWHSVRTATLKEPVVPQVAFLSRPADVGHLYWLDRKERLLFALADTKAGKPGAPTEVKTPFKGQPLASAMSLTDGTLLVPFAAPKKDRFALLHADQGGEVAICELDLGKVKPIGPFACYWEYDFRLHFAWAAPNGRQIEYAMLPLDDPSGGFVSKTCHITYDPIIWLDAYLDTTIPPAPMRAPFAMPGQEQEEEDIQEPPPPKLAVWCVTGKGRQVVCSAVWAMGGEARSQIAFDTGGPQNLRVIHSVVTHRWELAMLLADAERKLYYASTMRRQLLPLGQVIGKELTEDNCPSLVTPGRYGLAPFVHLRYVSRGVGIEYARLDPVNVEDAVEKGARRAPSGPPAQAEMTGDKEQATLDDDKPIPPGDILPGEQEDANPPPEPPKVGTK
jgi:hypothetical protein